MSPTEAPRRQRRRQPETPPPEQRRRRRARRSVDTRDAACSASRHRRHQRLRRPGPADRYARRQPSRRTAAGSTRSPTRSSAPDRAGLTDAVEKVVVHRGEITFHVRREDLLEAAQLLRDDDGAALRVLLRRQRRALPRRHRARAARGLPPALDDPQPPDPARGRLPRRRPAHPEPGGASTRPTTGTSARPTTSSASSSTATRR